jgi:membrane-associated phospholipid phosphatase
LHIALTLIQNIKETPPYFLHILETPIPIDTMIKDEKTNLVRQVSTSIHNARMDIERYGTQQSFSSIDANETDSILPSSIHNQALRRKLLNESLLCIFTFIFGFFSPTYLWRPIFGINMRPIPYQQLKSGEVVLDPSLNQELVLDVTIPSSLLLHTSITLPIILLILFTQFVPQYPPARYIDTHAAVCVLLLTIGLSEFTTQIAKFYVGRLRPNFYKLCDFDIEKLSCTASEQTIMESRSSFPSGHSSMSTAGMTVLVLFFLGRSGLGMGSIKSSKNGRQQLQQMMMCRKRKIATLMALAPLGWSIFVACSRLVDNWHHPSDVVAGVCLGLFFPVVTYHMWYPSVLSENAGLPLSYLEVISLTGLSVTDKDFA